jgi:hypothetical protein
LVQSTAPEASRRVRVPGRWRVEHHAAVAWTTAKHDEAVALVLRRDVLLEVFWSAKSSAEEVTAARGELDEVWARLKQLVDSGLESSRN